MSVSRHQNQNYCSPSKIPHKTINTCFDSYDIKTITQAFNNYIKTSKICKNNTCISSKPIDLNKDDEQLYEELTKRLNILCEKEFCWTDLQFIRDIPDKNLRDSILYFTFKPKGLRSKKTWFNTTNINEIMDQYQDLYKTKFKFLGAQPSDFSKIIKLDWKKLKQISYIAIIFNTDPHDKPGAHWIGVFIDNKQKTVDYFDSLGKLPNKNIGSFLKYFKKYKFTFNQKEHQKGGSNCGVYSCYFIIERLKGKSFEDITKKLIPDKMMTDYRSFLFRPA
jgi:hypothetical protein